MGSKTGHKTFACGLGSIEVEYEYDDAKDLAELGAASIIGWRQVGADLWLSADYLEEGIVEIWESEINGGLKSEIAGSRAEAKAEARTCEVCE